MSLGKLIGPRGPDQHLRLVPKAKEVAKDRLKPPRQPDIGGEDRRRSPDDQDVSRDRLSRLWDRQRHPR